MHLKELIWPDLDKEETHWIHGHDRKTDGSCAFSRTAVTECCKHKQLEAEKCALETLKLEAHRGSCAQDLAASGTREETPSPSPSF
ncbi:hypothetical protein LEMLEM_LOCUS12645 [Lemmus lemmus]